MRRREFLIASSMSAAGLAAASPVYATRAEAAVAASAGSSSFDAQAIVYEPRHLVACEFAQLHAGRGARVFGADGCMVQLWRGPLAQIVSRGDARIAGLTTYSDFSIARDCARDHGLSVLQESWCRETPVALVHWLIGA